VSAYSTFSYAAYALSVCALVHLSSLLIGPSVIEFLGLPPNVVIAAQSGDWIHVVSTIMAVAFFYVLMAWLCFRARPPLVISKISRFVLWVFAIVCTLRGLSVVLFMSAMLEGNFGSSPLKVWFFFWASIFMLTIGVALISGLLRTRKLEA